eukprot:GHVQ01042597.1.p1 GENE.GHVQ01042597.1~~GHVQ01042597.1.p1  ORF type:complete len:182 (+),score=17.87 GHVQ01042597.1:933-1478(+)
MGTREREAYAIKWGLERCKDMIRGHKIYVLTDHASLQWAKDAPQSKIQRWMWYIQQFDVDILYIPRELNPIADWLSRCNVFSADHDSVVEEVAVPLLSVVTATQLRIPGVTQLKECFSNIPEDEERQCYVGVDELLYSVKVRKLFIPNEYREIIMFWVHAGPYGGHRGVNATARKIKQYVW